MSDIKQDLKAMVWEFASNIKNEKQLIKCEDGAAQFIDIGTVNSQLDSMYTRIDQGEFDAMINKIKAEALRDAFLDGAACFGVKESTALEAWETSDSKIKLERGEA